MEPTASKLALSGANVTMRLLRNGFILRAAIVGSASLAARLCRAVLALERRIAKLRRSASSSRAVEHKLRRMRQQMMSLKMKQLKKMALDAGILDAVVADVDDTEDPKAAIIGLMLKARRAQMLAAPRGAENQEAAVASLRAKLAAMKMGALRRSARAAGVDPDVIDDLADEADDPRSALVDLIVEETYADSGPNDTHNAEEAVVASIRCELTPMKMGALRRRARAAGVDHDAIDDLDDEVDDPRSALVDLILAKVSPVALKSHAGDRCTPTMPEIDVQQPRDTSSRFKKIFGQTHCMLSYSWSIQKEVTAIRSLIQKEGVPTWMDIDGGMKADIYDSMAEGVSGAACVLAFMNQAYQDSQNCALELKFAKQSGVPIVPLMMEIPDTSGRQWTSSGWLGIITAGAIWIPMYEKAQWHASISNLLRQIEVTVTPEEKETQDNTSNTSVDFSPEDIREELERLRNDERPAECLAIAGDICAVPSQVPEVARGLQITSEMKQLAAVLMTGKKRVGLCGVGGVGKTTILCWLVRNNNRTRQQFEQIIWITIGQDPNIDHLMESIHIQLTGRGLDGKTTLEEKQRVLKQSMSCKRLLLVLDDLWKEQHERALNLIDGSTPSTVLISTRVRGLLAGAEIVDVGLPTEQEAVQMLLSVAEISAVESVPQQAREMVVLCDRLPLSLAIVGKLVRECRRDSRPMNELDWAAILEQLQEEFSDSDQHSRMQDRIIRTSLRSIKGPHRKNILQLFDAFATVPEDARIPIEMVQMLYEAGENVTRAKPSLLSIRRWLKVLIDRSLILGSVDRPSLHDLVRDYLISCKSDEVRSTIHCRLVELWRSRRPIGFDRPPGREPGGWNVDRVDSAAQYIAMAAVHHITGALSFGLESQKTAIDWLSDLVDGRQDAVPVFTAQALGPERVAQFAKAAEQKGDWWSASLYWSASAQSEHRIGAHPKSLSLLHKSASALARMKSVDPLRDPRFEMRVLMKAVQSYDSIAQAKGYESRIQQLMDTNGEAFDLFDRIRVHNFVIAIPALKAGNINGFGTSMYKLANMSVAALNDVHPSDRTQRCKLLALLHVGCLLVVTQRPDFNWVRVFGEQAEMLAELAQHYDYDTMHAECAWTSFDWALSFPAWGSVPLLHFGNVHAANKAFDSMLPAAFQCLQAQQPSDAMEILCIKTTWPIWLLLAGRKTDALSVLHAGAFATVESTVAWLETVFTPNVLSRRNDVSSDSDKASISAADVYATMKFMEILTTDHELDDGATANILGPHEALMLGVTLPWGSFLNVVAPSTLPALLAYDRLGSAEDLLACAALVLEADRTRGGTDCKLEHCIAHACRARVLTARGKLGAEAEAAFEMAIAAADAAGCPFIAAIILRDLIKQVLDTAGRGQEGHIRLKAVVAQLACTIEDVDAFVFPFSDHFRENQALGRQHKITDTDPVLMAIRSDLQGLRAGQLRKNAAAVGVDSEALESAEEADDVKAALVELIVSRQCKLRAMEQTTAVLASGGQETIELISHILEKAAQFMEVAVSSTPRKGRKAMRELLDRVESLVEVVNVQWCARLTKCSQEDLAQLGSAVASLSEVLSGQEPHPSATVEVLELMECLDRCGSVLLQSVAILSAPLGTQSHETYSTALEHLRMLSLERLESTSLDEVAASVVVSAHMSDDRMSVVVRASANLALFALGCRNGLEACVAEGVWENICSSIAAGLEPVVSDAAASSGIVSKGALDMAGASSYMIGLATEAIGKCPPCKRKALDEVVITSLTARAKASERLSDEFVLRVLSDFLDQTSSDTENLSLECATIDTLGSHFVYTRPSIFLTAHSKGYFSTAWQLHQKAFPSPLTVDFFASTVSVIDYQSALLATQLFVYVTAVRFLPPNTLTTSSWWTTLVQESIHYIKVNHLARLSEAETMAAWTFILSFSALSSATNKVEAIHPLLLESSLLEALEYACVNDFGIFGKNLAAEAAGTLVRLVGRNEGGKTLSRATVNSVMSDLQRNLSFRGRWRLKPLATVLNVVKCVSTMAVSDANKLLMLEAVGAVETMVTGLLLNSSRRSEDGADALQEACAALLLSLALHKPWADVLRAHEGAMMALRDLQSVGKGTQTARKTAESALFELEGGVVPKSATTSAKSLNGRTLFSTKHVFLSYCWDQQQVIKRIHAVLVKRGYECWIDVEQMKGSTVESMALAVENAEVVLIGVSRQYKESTNCRLEAQYAMQREVPTIPLMLVDGYRADGWLGMLIGTRMWYGFYGAVLTDASLFEGKVSELCRDLGDRGRMRASVGGATTVSLAASTLLTLSNKQLRLRAREAGAAEDDLELVLDSEHPKQELVELITRLQSAAPEAGTAAYAKALETMSNKELRQRAMAAGATSKQFENVADSEDPKQELISILVELERPGDGG